MTGSRKTSSVSEPLHSHTFATNRPAHFLTTLVERKGITVGGKAIAWPNRLGPEECVSQSNDRCRPWLQILRGKFSPSSGHDFGRPVTVAA